MKANRLIFISSLGLLLAGFGPAANAAGCSGTLVGTTCTLVGPTISYQYEIDQAAVTLFGDPELIGSTDTLRFDPDAFIAESLNGLSGTGGTVTTTAKFEFDRVFSNDGSNIMLIGVLESGDYEIETGDRVSADLRLEATENIFSGLFPDSTSGIDAFEATADTGGVVVDWSLGANVDPSAAFESASDIFVSIQNTLLAETDALGERAFIQKKLTFTAAVVPVPAAVWMFGSALGLLAWVRRRTV